MAQTNELNTGKLLTTSDVTQNAATVNAGGNLAISAGQDLTATASTISATGNVALSATNNLSLSSAADETHSYSKTHKATKVTDHVAQVGASVMSGGTATLNAGQDLTLTSSNVSSAGKAYVYAGDNLTLQTADNVDSSYYSKTKKGSFGRKSSKMTQSDSEQAQSSTIDASSDLVLSATKDVDASGAQLSSGNTLTVSAGHDINLAAAQDFESEASASSKKGLLSSSAKASSSSQTSVTSTALTAQSIDLEADNNLALSAASLKAADAATLKAGNDISIGTAQTQASSGSSKQSSTLKFGFGLTDIEKAAQGQQSSTTSVGSTVSAGSIAVTSGRDTAVTGSTLVADNDVSVNAGRNLSVVSDQDTAGGSSKSSSRKTGEIGSWGQSALGTISEKQTSSNANVTQVGSEIASLGGTVDLTAAQQYNQIASQVIAPKGDINIKAQQVNIVAGADTLQAANSQSVSRTAIGGTVDVPLLDAVKGVQQAVTASQNTSDGRMLALAAANATMSGYQGYRAATDMANSVTSGVKVSVNLSNSKSKESSNQSGSNVVPNTLAAGGNIAISAQGAGSASDLNVVGSTINAGQDVSLVADGAINLLSAQNTAHQTSSNSSSGWSVGIGFGFGQSSGFTLDLAADRAVGNSKGDNTSQTNTEVTAGGTASLTSTGDTSLRGAVIAADQVQANVGGDLNLESLQDTNTYKSKQSSASVGVSLCVPPFCYGTSSISGSVSQEKMDSNYASVSEQTGIKAGDDGFQLNVAGNTDLKGAEIASSAQAVTDNKNSLTTGTLTTSDIKNKADYRASDISLGGSYGMNVGSGTTSSLTPAQAKLAPVQQTEKGASASTPIVLVANGSESSETRSGISGAQITIGDSAKQQALTGQTAEQAVAAVNTDVSSDKDSSNKLKTIFNEKELSTDFQIASTFVQDVSTFVATKAKDADEDAANAKAELAESQNPDLTPEQQQTHRDNYVALTAESKALINDWGAGGTYRQIATALVAGISGNVTGSTSEFAQNMVVNYVQQQGAALIGQQAAQSLGEGSPALAALHAIVGCAGAAASNQSCSAGAMGAAAATLLTNLFSDPTPDETEAQRDAKANVISTLVAGIAGMTDASSAATATGAATANVDNNWLATQQYIQKQKEMDAQTTWEGRFAVELKWDKVSASQNIMTTEGLGKGLADGLAGSGLSTLNSVAVAAADPVGTMHAINEWIVNADVQTTLGPAYAQFKADVDQFSQELDVGGDDNAEQMGYKFGQILAIVASAVVAPEGEAAEGASELAKLGITVSSKEYAAVRAEGASTLDAQLAALDEATGFTGAKGGPASNLNPTSAITDAEAGTSGLAKIGSLKGEPELPPKNASPDMIRSIERQNEASKGLAQAGYDVEQLANSGKKGANPDLRINGELADVFSPITNSPISVLKTITGKVETQASNIVVNLADSPLTFEQIENALRSNPVEGLKTLYLMKGGEFRVIGAAK